MKHFIIINGLNVRHIEAETLEKALENTQNYSDHSKEIILREIEPKITYYLFGTEAVNSYEKGGIKRVLKDIKEYQIGFASFAFIEGVSKSGELLEASDDWMDYCTITKEEYDKL